MSFILNQGQERVVRKAADWYFHGKDQVFEFSGGPGTGKSVVLNEIVNRIRRSDSRVRVAPMAYTGAATVVMRMKGMPEAKTIHSWIYKRIEEVVHDKYGNIVYDEYFHRPMRTFSFVPNTEGMNKIDLIVIDEGSMVPVYMRDELMKTGKKILVTGDIFQLPPVESKPGFLTDINKIDVLTEIMRQDFGSMIVQMSQNALRGMPFHLGYHENCLVIRQHELTNEMLYNANAIICGTNATRVAINNHFRKNILNISGPFPCVGEKLICKKNNWFLEAGGINLTNGMSGIIITQPDIRSYKNRMFRLSFNPVITGVPFMHILADYEYLVANEARQKEIRKGVPKHNDINLFDYGYAQTVHSAQGSQWRTGIYIRDRSGGSDITQLDYTAISRFSDSCIIVVRDEENYRPGRTLR